jgi:hypothetical protein
MIHTGNWYPLHTARNFAQRRSHFGRIIHPSKYFFSSLQKCAEDSTMQNGAIIAREPCYCDAILINIDMRDGIFSFYIRSDETVIRAIAIVENDSIRGFNRSHIYSIERLEYSLHRLRKDRNTNWRVKATAYTRQGVSMRGFPAKLEGEEGDEQFWFEGGSDANRRVRVEIQGAWLQNLPWNRAAYRQKAA